MALLQRTTSPDFGVGGNTTISSSQVKAEFNNIINGLNGSADIQVINATATGNLQVDGNTTIGSNSSDTLTINATIAGTAFTINSIDVMKALVPIGSIIPFYDFNAALTFDTTYWVYCDGSSATIGGSSRTTPDLSNRYLVGFGTEGGGDMDTASWSTSVVGNASHQIDISHTHDMANHTHTGPSHTHTWAYFANGGGNNRLTFNVGDQAIDTTATDRYISTSESSAEYLVSQTAAATSAAKQNTTAGGTGNTGAPSSNTTSSSGSATQSIQPRSIRVRFIMRAK